MYMYMYLIIIYTCTMVVFEVFISTVVCQSTFFLQKTCFACIYRNHIFHPTRIQLTQLSCLGGSGGRVLD